MTPPTASWAWPGDLADLIRGLARDVLGLLGGASGGVLRLTSDLPGSLLGLARRLPGGPVTQGSGALLFHGLGRLYHVAVDDSPVCACSLDFREVHAPLPRLATRRVRGIDLPLPPELVRVESRDVLLGLVETILDARVIVHQLLVHRLEGFLASPRNLVRQTLQRGTALLYLLLERLGRITKVLLSQVHGPLLDLLPGLLDAPVQPLQCLRLSFGHLFLLSLRSFFGFASLKRP